MRLSFKFISLRWTYKYRYMKFINNESEQEKGIYNKYINSFLSQTLSKKFISRYFKLTQT